MAWQPGAAGVQQVVALLQEFQRPGANQAEAYSQLDKLKEHPHFCAYLAHVFASGEGLSTEIRQSAGLLLKNNLRRQWAALGEELRAFIKAALLQMLGSPVRALRHTAGTCVVTIVVSAGMASWPALVGALVEALASGDANAVDGALDTIAEEQPLQLEAEVEGGGRPNDALVPAVLALFGAPTPPLRAVAVATLNLLSDAMPAALAANLDAYLQGLFTLAHDPSAPVRKAVCTGLVHSVLVAPERLRPSMPDIIEYMLASTQDGDEGVAVESCEFWAAFCDSQLESDVLRPFLPRILPVLLKNMVYEEYDEEVQEAEELEERALGGAAAADKDEEIKPYVHRGAGHGEEEEEEEEEEVGQWNLRRCSAAGLDVLSTVFGDELLPVILPIVQQRLQEPEWRARESAILALGAISEGCATGLTPFLPGMVALLLPTLRDPRPMVRCISCWALSRYSKWVLENAEAGQQAELDGLVAGLCERTLDPNRRVQARAARGRGAAEAACSGLAALVEEAGPRIAHYQQQARGSLHASSLVLQTLAATLARYGRKTLRNAYDAVTTLAEAAPAVLRTPPAQALLGPLFAKFGALQASGGVADGARGVGVIYWCCWRREGDKELLPLMECLTSIVAAAGPQAEGYAEACFFRCVAMAELADQAASSGSCDPEEAADFIVCALDLVSGLAEGLGPSIESLVGRSALRDLVVRGCKDPNAEIRQSAFALVCAPHIKPAAPQIFASAMYNLEPQMVTQHNMSACNNACWSLGELAIKCSTQELSPVALQALERLAMIISVPTGGLPRSLIENAAISLGRLAWVCPDQLAPHASHYLAAWCAVLRGIRDDIEKEHAFLGLCTVVRLNPQSAVAAFVPLCEAVASWRAIGCEGLQNELRQLMQGLKAGLAGVGQWEPALGGLSPAVRQKLADTFQL
eukprot:scaffold12.g8169.t1